MHMSFGSFRQQVERLVGPDYARFLKKPAKGQADLALLCFTLREPPQTLAERFMGTVKKGADYDLIGTIAVEGQYINFFIKQDVYAERVLRDILAEKGRYGCAPKTKKTAVVEYSQPNTNKPLHIGHLRNDSIGMCVSRLLEAAGWRVVTCSILNDRGVHICKSMLAYERWGKGATPRSAKKKSDHFVGDYYVLFEQKAKEDPNLNAEIQDMLRKWEAGDRTVRALWKKMNTWAIDGFRKTYEAYGSEFDVWFFESKIYEQAKPIVEEGLTKGVFVKDPQGAIIAKLVQHGLPDKYVTRSDGTSTYLSQDLPLAPLKFDRYHFDTSIHVVASEQNL